MQQWIYGRWARQAILPMLFILTLVGCTGNTRGTMTEQANREFSNYAEFAAARQFVDTQYGRVAVVENGTGPAAVFLHGFPLNGFHWRYQLTELADLRRCIAIDLMGLGHTEIRANQELSFSAQAQMVLATLDALGVKDFDLVGNDTGGGIAQIIATKVPARIRSLVLTNADIHDNWPPKALGVVHAAATDGVLDDLFVGYLANPEQARNGLGSMVFEDPQYLTAELLEAYLGPITTTAERRDDINRFITSQNNAETVAIKSNLERLTAPTLILWGTGDPFFGVEWAYWLRDTIPGVRNVIEFPQAKLFFPEERAEEVTAHIRNHWLQ